MSLAWTEITILLTLYYKSIFKCFAWLYSWGRPVITIMHLRAINWVWLSGYLIGLHGLSLVVYLHLLLQLRGQHTYVNCIWTSRWLSNDSANLLSTLVWKRIQSGNSFLALVLTILYLNGAQIKLVLTIAAMDLTGTALLNQRSLETKEVLKHTCTGVN